MEIQVQRLRSALELLEPIVPRKSTLPVLVNVLLKDGTAMATDLETAVALELPEAEGEVLIPFRPVAELLKRVPGRQALALEREGKSLHLAWSEGKASYEAHDPVDYPPIPQVKARVRQAVDGDTLVSTLLKVVDYCSTQSDRPVLMGVAVNFGEGIEVAAGDGFRMAFQTLPLSFPVEGIGNVVIPARAVRVLGHLWKGTPRPAPMASSLVRAITARRQMELAVGDEMLEAQLGPATLITRLIVGTPPNWRQLIPQENPFKVGVMALDFERAVRQVQKVAKDSSGIVRLSWSEAAMRVWARSEDMGEAETTVSVPPWKEGGSGRIALKVSYLLDYLKDKEGMVEMGVRSEQEAVQFRHSASPLVLVMPMHVQW